ncbi:hypothetical protein BATDEDRAFT_28504 [Batrachochytrium dendrobatidis JAM81]|uniref:Uncharacterized protein n=2 Tax=Batrachochytrium dendrobatidis TaxID=109871 RepID=F4PDX7_BATDJ|nr:uncharacterized protein BATDEDRAFT_28504 [Batrachochytrium dendrobatidis JAM81]EGF76627.1 hypothetical protein BATDEDRAFT_28504 [Batrachochytrium dendrobatidis JAM81]OAJ39302.1 hypothetical protein BDEG_23163 [Batrachochytrium dendrobatidis JEL423]|eukprot:XP_006682833.1 hypothetical protein BATDEDRAFT_28504 [Batrachochytrium dendrobatidis JAM81]
MKFLIALSSILFTCSVTTASPILPTVTTGAESSSTTLSSSTTSTYSSFPEVPNATNIGSVDFSKLSDDAMNSIKEYLETSGNYQIAMGICNSTDSENLDQKILVNQLGEDYKKLKLEYQSSKNVLKYGVKLEKAKRIFKKQKEILSTLTKRYLGACLEYSQLGLKLDILGIKVIRHLFGGHLDILSLYYYLGRLELDPDFMKLVNASRNYVLSQESKSDQASTS